MRFDHRHSGRRGADRRMGFLVRHGRFGRLGLWAALFAVFCQIVIPIGHDAILLAAGERCPGLDLSVGNGPHREATGTAATARAPQPAAQEQGQVCPIFQTFLYLAPLGSSGPAPLPPPQFAALRQFPADWAGLPVSGGAFSRPFPRAPPAQA